MEQKAFAAEEIQAIEMTTANLGAALMEIGLDRKPEEWSEDEAKRLIYLVVTGYQINMGEIIGDGVPF